MLAVDRDDSTVLPGVFRLAVAIPGEQEPAIQVINGPCALIGRSPEANCHLEHPDVRRRHAYLQALYGRIYGVDLCGRTLWNESRRGGNESHRKGGWLDPDVSLGIGPYQLRLVDAMGLGVGAEQLLADFNPLDRYEGQFGPLPKAEIEFLTGTALGTRLTVSRVITLVGSSPRCKLRLEDHSVSSIHCSLVWLNDGLWVVDLAGKGGTRIRSKPTRCAKLEDGQKFRVGQFVMRIHYSGERISRAQPVAAEPAQTSEAGLRSVDARPADAGPVELRPVDSRPDVAAEDSASKASSAPGDGRSQQMELREAKLGEAQKRLASEWDRLHVDRAALTTFSENLARQRDEIAGEARRLSAEAESLGRQREEVSARAAELTETRKFLKAEWQKLVEARARMSEAREQLVEQREENAQLKAELERYQGVRAERPRQPAQNQDLVTAANPSAAPDPATVPDAAIGAAVATEPNTGASEPNTSDSVPNTGNGLNMGTGAGSRSPVAPIVYLDDEEPQLVESTMSRAGSFVEDFDPFESTRHNTVFQTERSGNTLIVLPLGDASEFHYKVVHTESNKVRRLLEGEQFLNLVVDLGNVPLFSAVMINAFVALSRIAANRGGRALLCNASEKTRGVLQSMKLLEIWPLHPTRAEALAALGRE